MYLNQPFTGEADEMNFYFLENIISFSKNLMLIIDDKEYKGQNIEIITKDKSIMGSDKISINKINDFKNKKDLSALWQKNNFAIYRYRDKHPQH